MVAVQLRSVEFSQGQDGGHLLLAQDFFSSIGKVPQGFFLAAGQPAPGKQGAHGGEQHGRRLIRAGTLVIAGPHDMIRRDHTCLIAEHIPDAKLVFLKGDHFIAGKHPEEFNRAVLDFLNR